MSIDGRGWVWGFLTCKGRGLVLASMIGSLLTTSCLDPTVCFVSCWLVSPCLTGRFTFSSLGDGGGEDTTIGRGWELEVRTCSSLRLRLALRVATSSSSCFFALCSSARQLLREMISSARQLLRESALRHATIIASWLSDILP